MVDPPTTFMGIPIRVISSDVIQDSRVMMVENRGSSQSTAPPIFVSYGFKSSLGEMLEQEWTINQ